MSTMRDINLDALFYMFKGEWGTRKSTCALSFPTPQYWVSWDRKMQSIYVPMKKWGIDEKLVEYDDYSDWNKVETKLKRLQVQCDYKTIIVDSISSGGDAINAQTLAVKSSAKGDEGGKRIAGIPVNSMEDWNAETAVFQTLMRILKDINEFHKVNIIIIAHVMQVDMKTPDGKVHVSRSIVTGAKKAAVKIPALCQEVYHFNMKGDFTADPKYALLTTHSRDDYARTCLPLDKEIVFEDRELYKDFILPAITKAKKMEPPKRF